MPAKATQLFGLLDQPDFGLIERHEVLSIEFNMLRRSARFIITSLSEGDDGDGRELSDRLRSLLSKWLTVPVLFDGEIGSALCELGDPDEIGIRWGNQIRNAFDAACAAAERMSQCPSPMRTELCSAIEDMHSRKVRFKIYCHRTARQVFETLNLPDDCKLLDADAFIHSPKDYREAEPFDTLIKIGPLRSRGWGSVPDAVLTAPRSKAIVQIVWSGCEDEQGFGYDPLSPAEGSGGETPSGRGHKVEWRLPVVTHCGDDPADDLGLTEDEDEFKIFAKLGHTMDTVRCTLVQIDDDHGILYPPHSQVLGYDPTPGSESPIGNRLPGESLMEGMFVVLPLLDDIDLGGLHAEEGHYSRIWKELLTEEFTTNPLSLGRRLRASGVGLIHLQNSIERWCRPATTVIHAPQQRKHFEILIKVLEIDFDDHSPRGERSAPWWQYAWNEIRRARGEAIQMGRYEHDLVEEQTIALLNELLPEIESEAESEASFIVAPPQGHGLHGSFAFHKIKAIEGGYLAPISSLRMISDLDEILQWRE